MRPDGVGPLGREDFVAARHQPHLDLAPWLGRGQRIDEHVDAVVAGIGREPHVGDDEPLRRHRIGIVGRRALGRRRHHIDARRHVADRLIDRKRRGDLGVERLLDGELAVPHLDAAALGQPLDLVGVEVALEVAAEHGLDQIAVADPVDVDADRLGVDADQRDAALTGARQHIGLAGEARHGLAVAHIDREVGRLRQRLLDGRRQPGAQGHAVALAVLQPLDAELLVVGGQRELVLAGNRDERREIGALARQRLGELEAGARRRRSRHRRYSRAGGSRDPRASSRRARERRRPRAVRAKAGAHRAPAARPDGRRSCGRRSPARRPPRCGSWRADRRCRRRCRSARCSARRSRSRTTRTCWMARARRSQLALSSGAWAMIWPSSTMPLRTSFFWKAASASRRNCASGFADLSGVVLDLGFELDRGFVELGPLERLAGGGRWNGTQGNRRKGDERGNAADAELREHGLSSSSPLGGNFRGGDHPSTIPNHVRVVTEKRRRLAGPRGQGWRPRLDSNQGPSA